MPKYKVDFILDETYDDSSVAAVKETIREAIEDHYDEMKFVGEINVQPLDNSSST